MPRRRRRFASRARHCLRALLAFLFSNVGVTVLVIGYTIAGAFMFQAVEGEKEMEQATLMTQQRLTTAQMLWSDVTVRCNPMDEREFKSQISTELLAYQRRVVMAARRGWDGDRTSRQWSFSSAFLYSLTVITTIGYGHLSPRTEEGKILTIFYALLGMPLFLLYLTTVGELLARWFKCLYALVCLCRGCPGFRMRRVVKMRSQLEISDVESIERPEDWRHDPAFSIIQNQRHADDRFHPQNNRHLYERYRTNGNKDGRYAQKFHDVRTWDRFPPYRENFYRDNRFKDSDRYQNQAHLNRYDRYQSHPPFVDTRTRDCYKRKETNDLQLQNVNHKEKYRQDRQRCQHKPRMDDMYTVQSHRYPKRYPEDSRIPTDASHPSYQKHLHRRAEYLRSTSLPMQRQPPTFAAARGWSEPVGAAGDSLASSDFSYVTFDAQTITVPISVCVAIMVGYLIFGSMLFRRWEDWGVLDGSYFCFISLSSIGFGDFVPGERVYAERIEAPFIVCSLYLMLGMALVAMCFNLMQEQVIHYFSGLKRALKRICRCRCKR